MRRNRIVAAAAGLVIVVYSGWWWLTAQTLTTRIDRWIAGEQGKGAKITPAVMSVGGYPFVFSVKLTDVSLAWPSGFGFSSQSLKLRSRPWSMRSFKISAAGGFEVALPAGKTRPALILAGETLKGHASFQDTAAPLAIDLAADTVSVAQTTPDNAPPNRELTAATMEFDGARPATPPTADTDVAYDLSLKLIDLSALALEGNPLGGTISRTALHAQLLGPLPAHWDDAGIREWRGAGGTVDLTALSLQWGPLALSGNGTLALDTDMQPEGAFTAHLSGYEQALDALAAAGWMKLSAASLAKLALGIASHPGPDGKPAVETPLTIQNRHISAGAIKLGQVPELKLD